MVVEKKLYDKIETLNILNGGIKKEFIVTSTKLDNDSIKKYYPEFFAYDAKICVKINQVVDYKVVDYKSKPKKYKNSILTREKEIKTEIKKIKLLQLLNDFGENFTTSTPNETIIKSTGVICTDGLYFRGQNYKANTSLGTLELKQMDLNNGTLYVKQK